MSATTIIGTSVKRTDLLGKVTGDAKYVADMAPAGLLYARTKRSNVAHALIRRIDTSKALALPGVKAVLTHEAERGCGEPACSTRGTFSCVSTAFTPGSASALLVSMRLISACATLLRLVLA